MLSSDRPTAAILLLAYRIISGTEDRTALKIFHEMQASILLRRAEAGDHIRRAVHDPEDRETEYQKLDEQKDKDLFRGLWSCFPEVRKVYPSSVLANNTLGSFV